MTSCEEKQGKTIFSLITSEYLAENNKVLLVDLSSSEKDCSHYLDVKEQVIYDVVDLIKDTCSMEQAVIKIEEENFQFDFLPAPRLKDKYKKLDLGHLKKIFMESNGIYDHVIIDGSSIVDDVKTASYEIIDLAIILSYSKIEDVKEIFSSLNIIGKDVKDIKLVINKISEKDEKKGNSLTVKEIEELLKVPVAGRIQFKPKYNALEKNFLSEGKYEEILNVVKKII